MADGPSTPYSDAEFWDRLVQGAPGTALSRARELIDGGGLTPDELPLAWAAVARSLFETGRLPDALAAARRALEDSARASRSVKSPVVMSASVILAEAGYVQEALDTLRAEIVDVDGVAEARVRMQIGYVLHHAGRLNEALEELEMAERLFARSGEDRDRLRVYQNRGLVLLQQGRLREAEPDFELAESIASSMGLSVAQGQGAANRAVLSGRARRLAESMVHFDRASALFAEAGNPARTVALTEIDRAEVMMHSGLLVDAVAAGRAAIAAVEPSGNVMLLGDAHLILARAELAAGSARRAIASAQRAAETFAASARTHMVPHARSVTVQAGMIGAQTTEEAKGHLDDAVDVAAELRAAGWAAQADDLAVARMRAARRWGLVTAVRDDVERLRVRAADGQRDTALSCWYAEAVAQIADGRVDDAVAACHSGLGVLDDIVAEAPTLEDRSAAMRMGSDLSQLLIEIAVARGDADTVLAAAEGTRARALHEELADSGRHRPLTIAGAERLRDELTVRLGGRVLVEWVVHDLRIAAVVFGDGAPRLVDIGTRADVVRARDRVGMWLDRAAAEPDGSSARAAHAASTLDATLLAPLSLPPHVGVVLVPTDVLHGIPWSGLPTLADRPCSLAPNAQVWLEADRRTAHHVGSVGLVVGPDVAGSDLERAAVESAHARLAVASGPGAGAATVRAMLAETDLVHVAAHGTFRSDHPLLSTLRLHDGEATLYDAVPDRVGSRLVVLSSCEGGAQGTADGSEVLGLSAVLLARGAAAVLAPLTVVRELECAEFVAEVHGELATGEAIACAVANVRQRWLADDDLSRWAVASSFTCFGSGAVALAR